MQRRGDCWYPSLEAPLPTQRQADRSERGQGAPAPLTTGTASESEVTIWLSLCAPFP